MDTPLGRNVGNSLEVIEAIEVLKGGGPEDLRYECITLATEMLYISNKADYDECKRMVENSLKDNSAFEKFVQMVELQGGDTKYIYDVNLFEQAEYQFDVKAKSTGYISEMNSERCGIPAGTDRGARCKKPRHQGDGCGAPG